MSNLCNFQFFASNIYGNNIDQRPRNCGEAKTFMGPTYILCKISNFLSTLDWERPSLRRKKQKASMMYKTMNDLAPEYLQSLFSQRHSAYNLKNSEGRLTLSKPSTNYLKRSFSYSGAMLWNNLTKSSKNAASAEHFKRNIKTVADISDSHTVITKSSCN